MRIDNLSNRSLSVLIIFNSIDRNSILVFFLIAKFQYSVGIDNVFFKDFVRAIVAYRTDFVTVADFNSVKDFAIIFGE